MTRRNPNSETSILSPLVEFLEILSNQGKLRYFRAHPVRLVSKNGERFPVKVRESQRGAPDIFVWLFPRKYSIGVKWDLWIEGKSGKGKASKEQVSWKNDAETWGIPYFQPRTHGDVNAVIKWIRDRI